MASELHRPGLDAGTEPAIATADSFSLNEQQAAIAQLQPVAATAGAADVEVKVVALQFDFDHLEPAPIAGFALNPALLNVEVAGQASQGSDGALPSTREAGLAPYQLKEPPALGRWHHPTDRCRAAVERQLHSAALQIDAAPQLQAHRALELQGLLLNGDATTSRDLGLQQEAATGLAQIDGKGTLLQLGAELVQADPEALTGAKSITTLLAAQGEGALQGAELWQGDTATTKREDFAVVLSAVGEGAGQADTGTSREAANAADAQLARAAAAQGQDERTVADLQRGPLPWVPSPEGQAAATELPLLACAAVAAKLKGAAQLDIAAVEAASGRDGHRRIGVGTAPAQAAVDVADAAQTETREVETATAELEHELT